MISAEEGLLWRLYQVVVKTFTIGGGTVMLALAAIDHSSSSIAVLIIGGILLIMGLLSVFRDRGLARRVRLEGDSVLFMSQQNLSVPVADIIEVRRGRGDLNRMDPVHFTTLTQGTVRASARMRGLTELVAELRRANPHVRLGDL